MFRDDRQIGDAVRVLCPDGRPELSADELEELRDALPLLRALRALVKTAAPDRRGPVKVPPGRAPIPTDDQYAHAVANVAKRMKGRQ